ncbi:hypothetical protein EBR21_02975, partial [bacterium]|nr:hypothetical protein [bacterium]
MRSSLTTLLTTAVLAAGIAPACIRRSSSNDAAQAPSSIPAPRETVPENIPGQYGITGVIPLSDRSALGAKFADASLHDVFIALMACDCLPKLQLRLTTALNKTRGALPQSLVPAIRREILGNPKLKILNIVPRPLDDVVGGFFADEQSVAKEIDEGLRDKIKVAEPGWAELKDRPSVHLDAFIPLPGTVQPASGRTVRMLDVWSRWALILSQGGPWSSERLRVKDSERGLLWNELLRALAEGEYLFGLGSNGDGIMWGGLTLPVDLLINNPGPFDPRTTFSQVRFLTGQLDLTLPTNNSLSLARNGGERWTWRPGPPTLAEQSVQWLVSARLLNRLRPLNRGAFTTFYAALIPDDSYQLPLITLPSLDVLLSGRFIDENSRVIRAYISGEQLGGVEASTREKADPQTLGLLLMAMQAWIQELQTVSDLNVSRETLEQLRNAPTSLKRGAQLIAQTILGENVFARPVPSPESGDVGWSLYARSQDSIKSELTLRDHAQIVYALILAEHNFMASPMLRKRLEQLANGLQQRWQEKKTFDSSKESLAQQIWLKAAADTFVAAYPDSPQTPILRTLATEVTTVLTA